jgi:hypothetical protein
MGGQHERHTHRTGVPEEDARPYAVGVVMIVLVELVGGCESNHICAIEWKGEMMRD